MRRAQIMHRAKIKMPKLKYQMCPAPALISGLVQHRISLALSSKSMCHAPIMIHLWQHLSTLLNNLVQQSSAAYHILPYPLFKILFPVLDSQGPQYPLAPAQLKSSCLTALLNYTVPSHQITEPCAGLKSHFTCQGSAGLQACAMIISLSATCSAQCEVRVTFCRGFSAA